jgi:hypothetical protein
VFNVDVAKVDLDAANTCMLQGYVSSVLVVSYVRCKCFIWILYMFAMATHVFLSIFSALQVFQPYVASISVVFRRMLQVFHLDIAKVDLVLHMLQRDPHAAV